MSIRIDVTIEDIVNGKAASCQFCPVALAIKRIFPGKVIVGLDQIFIHISYRYENNLMYPTPDSVKRFISMFDGETNSMFGAIVAKPFSFVLGE